MREIHCKKRVLGWLLALMLGASAAQAQKASGPAFQLSAEPGIYTRVYRAEEPITFFVKREPGGKPAPLHYRVEENGLVTLHEGVVPAESEGREILALPQKPGFILLRVWEEAPAPAEGTLPLPLVELVAGAAIEPDQLGSSGEAPADFDEFWERKIGSLAQAPLEVLEIVPIESGNPEVLAWDVKVSAPGGKPVSGYLARPKTIKPHASPALVIYQGAGVRSADLGAAVEGASWGAICLQINAHGILNGQPDEYYAQLQAGEYDNYARRNAKDRETIYFGEMYVRALRALEYIETMPAWDGKTLIVAGESQGAAQALAAAALYPRVTAVFAGIPALCDLTALDAGRAPGWPFQKYTVEKPVPAAFAYFDTVHFAERVRVPGFYAVGLRDTIAPPNGGYRAYLMHAGSKEMLLMGKAAHELDAGGKRAYEAFVKAQIKAGALIGQPGGEPAPPPKVSFSTP